MAARSGLGCPVWAILRLGTLVLLAPVVLVPRPFAPTVGSFFVGRPIAFLAGPPIACTWASRCPIAGGAMPFLERSNGLAARLFPGCSNRFGGTPFLTCSSCFATIPFLVLLALP